MTQQAFQRDLQVAAFTALVQQLIMNPDRIFDYQQVLSETALALNISETQQAQIIQHQFELQPQSAYQTLTLDELEAMFQPQQRKSASIWQNINKNIMHELNLSEPYEIFAGFLKNGATTEDLKNLRDMIINAVSDVLK
ncbi:Hypothetical_protein [Hexamita inflata]|uniref:Hypothetical_protein n=1 Tax=Hexamita inflata TaxID=28002 RepID=A0AA86U1U2_9EUKA|nr:Hypothetical protein HINF_LOCUS15663 [Hexamita inflata]